MNKNAEDYSLNGFERSINKFFKFLFYYRLLLIVFAVLALGFLIWIVAAHSKPEDLLKNVSTVATCGSIVIGIFYSILNFEVSTINKRKDVAIAKKSLTFTVALEWHKDSFVKHLKIVKSIRDDHKELIHGNRSTEFAEILEKMPPLEPRWCPFSITWKL